MASYDNLLTVEQPWLFRTSFADAWTSDFFSKEAETLTKALQMSLASTTSSNGDVFPSEMFDSTLYSMPEISPVQTPTVSTGSENEVPISKIRRSLPPSGRVTKRKPRTSKRATTTFITADPENFRQMVQQVTGVNYGGFDSQIHVNTVLKPGDMAANFLQLSGGNFQTLDSSEFLLDGGDSSPAVCNGGAEHYFDSFCSFPTLESWKAAI